MPGFTDDCFPSSWIRVELPLGQHPAFTWLETPGVVCSSSWGIITANWWRFTKRIGLANVSVIIRFLPDIGVGQIASQVKVDIAFVPDFGQTFADQYIFDRINVSKITPWSSDSCLGITPGPNCNSTGPMAFDWWPTACGIPEAGPTVPA